MSSVLLHRWLALPFWLRLLLLVLCFITGALMVRQVWLRPLQQQALQVAQQRQQEHKRYRLLLHNLQQRSSLHEAEADIAGLQLALRPGAARPFSWPQLSEAAGNRLQGWQPTPQGGELTLLLSWPQLQSAFRYLSERQPAVRLAQFSLKRVDEQLRLNLVVQYER